MAQSNSEDDRAPPDGASESGDGEETADRSRRTGASLSTPGSTGDGDGDSSLASSTAAERFDLSRDSRTSDTDGTRVLEFGMAEQAYCLDITHVEEIVEDQSITRVPNSPAPVEGVVDIRGQVTTVLDPKVAMDSATDEAGELLIVFDERAYEDEGNIGWLVDEVRSVSRVPEDAIHDPPGDAKGVKGVVDRVDGDESVVWLEPSFALNPIE